MQSEQHQGKGLKYLTVLPDEYNPDTSYPLLILLHGFGANMQDLAGLAPAINRTGYVYACPNAPIPFDLGGGQVGYGWMTPRGMGTPEEAQEAVRQAQERLASQATDLQMESAMASMRRAQVRLNVVRRRRSRGGMSPGAGEAG